MSKQSEYTGQKIRECRRNMSISQLELASKLDISRVAVSRYESGDIDIPLSQLQKIATFFNTSPSYLLGWDDNPVQKNDGGNISKIVSLVSELNEAGQQKAVDYVEDLTQTPKYRK